MRIIQILGTGSGWTDYDKSKETWCVAKLIWKGVIPQKAFAMGALENLHIVRKGEVSLEYLKQKIKEHKIELITTENFPMDDIPVRYFTNSVCYMIAMALLQEYDCIKLYGVNQAGLFEYMDQRRGVEFWLGMAYGMGIDVKINPPSKLLTNRFAPYGYEETEGQRTETRAEGGIKRSLDLIGYLTGYRKE